MDNKTLKDLYNKCVYIKYTRVENDGDYAIERDGDALYLYFQCSYTILDWINNFNFTTVPYKDMEIEWKCHRGFLRVWKSIEPYIKPYVSDMSIKNVVITGYSHGAAIAGLAHEYFWFHRSDLRKSLTTYAFACPKFYNGTLPKEIQKRWEGAIVFRNRNDIVSYIPPSFLGYRHVSKIITLDSSEKNIFMAHTVNAYLSGIENYVKINDKNNEVI